MTPLDAATLSTIQRRVLDSRRNRGEHLAHMRDRQQEGLKAARQCAQILKQQFGATRVFLFGSLLEAEQMWWGSDIDLAVWGLSKALFLRAGAAIEKGHNFSVDLVDVQEAKPHILDAIEQGLEL